MMPVPEPVVQKAYEAARQAMWTPTHKAHRVPGITLEGAIRAGLTALWNSRCAHCGDPTGGGPGGYFSLVTSLETCSASPTMFHELI